MSFSTVYLSHLYDLSKKPLSEEDKVQIRRCLIDYLGVTFAGSRILQRKALAWLELLGEKCGTVPLPGNFPKTTLGSAVYLHGMFSHVAELDDGERFAMMHPGAPVLSALIPCWFHFGFSTQTFEKSVLVGYEASVLLSRMMQPELKQRFYHSTGITGTIGAAVALGLALEFTEKQLADLLSCACTASSGMLKIIRGNSELKPLNVSFAAQAALNAALSVKAGFKGIPNVMDGKDGFFKMFSGKIPNEANYTFSKEKRAIHDIYVKPYASCRHCHAPVEAALKLRNDPGSDKVFKHIRKIEVETYALAINGHDHTRVESESAAKMSIPYCVASALVTGSGFMDCFTTENLNSESIQMLTRRVTVIENKEMTFKSPEVRAARVRISFLNSGEEESALVLHPKGEPENPVSTPELMEKSVYLLKFAGIDENRSKNALQKILHDLSPEHFFALYQGDLLKGA